MKPQAILILLGYIAGITLANLTLVWLGPWASPVNAFFLIGFTFIARDALHELWRGAGLKRKMLGAIALAGIVSYLINPAAGRIAVASATAFAVSELADWLVYFALERLPWLARSNASNAVGALVDSFAFPLLAFGAIPGIAALIGLQYLGKLAGGAVWSLVFKRTIDPDRRIAERRDRAQTAA